MTIYAIPCNGVAECQDDADESWLCTDSNYLVFFVLCFLAITVLLATVWKWYTLRKLAKQVKKGDEQSEALQIFKITPRMVQENHCKRKLNVILWRNYMINKHEERIEQSQQFWKAELELHNNNKAETVACLKNYLKQIVYKTLFEDNNPGLFRRKAYRLEKKMKKLDGPTMGWLRWVMKKVANISAIYVDLFKDLYLGILILIIVGGLTSILTFPTKLTSVVVMATFTSVFGPLLISNLVLAIDRIEESKEDLSLQGKLLMLLKTMALSLANPILIINEKGEHL